MIQCSKLLEIKIVLLKTAQRKFIKIKKLKTTISFFKIPNSYSYTKLANPLPSTPEARKAELQANEIFFKNARDIQRMYFSSPGIHQAQREFFRQSERSNANLLRQLPNIMQALRESNLFFSFQKVLHQLLKHLNFLDEAARANQANAGTFDNINTRVQNNRR